MPHSRRHNPMHRTRRILLPGNDLHAAAPRARLPGESPHSRRWRRGRRPRSMQTPDGARSTPGRNRRTRRSAQQKIHPRNGDRIRRPETHAAHRRRVRVLTPAQFGVRRYRDGQQRSGRAERVVIS